MTEIDLYDIFQGQLAAFLLVLTRTSGIFLISPFFGALTIPIQFRAAASIAIAILIFPVITKSSVIIVPENMFLFALTVMKEFVIGWMIGFIAYVANRFRSCSNYGSDFRSTNAADRKLSL